MKKNSLSIISLSILFAFGCGQKSSNNASDKGVTDSTSISAEDKSLLESAQGIFKPLPANADNNPDNKITDQKVALGKVLYFDTRLSKTGKNSCNTCHNLNTYGVDNKATSIGDAGKNGERNSPTTLNAALQFLQFWDGRAKDVEEQAGMPVLNPVEMAIPNKDFLVKKLSDVKGYTELFATAFPDEKKPITYTNIEKAIAAFERTLISPSKFDNYLKGNANELNKEEKAGLSAFISNGCTACHSGALLGGTMFQKFGTVSDFRAFTGSTGKDEGRKNITKNEADKDMFKVPTLRNIARTFPYFHDGSVTALSSAVKIMGKVQFNKDLTDEEIKSIVAFLEALTGDLNADVMKPPTLP